MTEQATSFINVDWNGLGTDFERVDTDLLSYDIRFGPRLNSPPGTNTLLGPSGTITLYDRDGRYSSEGHEFRDYLLRTPRTFSLNVQVSDTFWTPVMQGRLRLADASRDPRDIDSITFDVTGSAPLDTPVTISLGETTLNALVDHVIGIQGSGALQWRIAGDASQAQPVRDLHINADGNYESFLDLLDNIAKVADGYALLGGSGQVGVCSAITARSDLVWTGFDDALIGERYIEDADEASVRNTASFLTTTGFQWERRIHALSHTTFGERDIGMPRWFQRLPNENYRRGVVTRRALPVMTVEAELLFAAPTKVDLYDMLNKTTYGQIVRSADQRRSFLIVNRRYTYRYGDVPRVTLGMVALPGSRSASEDALHWIMGVSALGRNTYPAPPDRLVIGRSAWGVDSYLD